jgi:hypothetical protein
MLPGGAGDWNWLLGGGLGGDGGAIFRLCLAASFLAQHSGKPEASAVAGCVGAATVTEFDRNVSGLFTDLNSVTPNTFHAHWLRVTISMRMVEPVARMVLGWCLLLAGCSTVIRRWQTVLHSKICPSSFRTSTRTSGRGLEIILDSLSSAKPFEGFFSLPSRD